MVISSNVALLSPARRPVETTDPPPERVHRAEVEPSARPTWIALGVFLLMIGANATGILSDVLYPAVTFGGVVCAVVGIRRHRVALRRPWWLLIATGVLWTIGGIISDATVTTGDLSRDRSLLPDLFNLPGYALFAAALYGIVRARRAPRDRGALLDGIMLAAGAALIVNEVLIAPTLTATDDSWVMARIAVASYPTISMCLLVLAGRLAFSPGERSTAFTLILLGTVSLLVGDVVYALGEVGTLVASPTLLEVPYLLVPALIGAAVLHPSIRLVDRGARTPTRPLGTGRLVAVAAALLSPIVLVTVSRSSEARIIQAVLYGVLVSAAVTRLFGAMRAQSVVEAELYHRATHDELTGLPSRELVIDQTDELLAADDRPLALMFLDLDQFKFVNDSMGHASGDELLVRVAERLTRSVLPSDLVGRISGDEFVIAAPGLGARGALALAGRVRAALREPVLLDQGEVFVTVSIGVTIADGHPERQAATLIQETDTAMYRSKDAGRDMVTVFDASMRERSARRVELERMLRRALDERQIEVWFQPIVALPSGRPGGLEALVRWQVDGRMISPAEFIPVAEESGLIVPLGAHVLDEACRQLAWWRRTDPAAGDLYVSVNLSPRQVRASDVVDTVADVLRRHDLPGDALWLEITESVMMEDSVTTTAVLTALRELGVRLAVDDFGTGYSSLSYLKRFPVSRVKIDQSFVAGLGEHESDTSLVAAIVAMASALDLEPVAEGVEQPEQARRLVELGCRHAQGFLYSSAVPAGDVPELLASLRGRSGARRPRGRRCAPIGRG